MSKTNQKISSNVDLSKYPINKEPAHMEKIGKQYQDIVENFRINNEDLIHKSKGSFNELVAATDSDVRRLKEILFRGNKSVIDKTQRANQELIKVAMKNCEGLMANTGQGFRNFKSSTHQSYDRKLHIFDTHMRNNFSHHPHLNPKPYQDLVAHLVKRFEDTMAECEKKYESHLGELDKAMANFIESMAFQVSHVDRQRPEIQPPPKVEDLKYLSTTNISQAANKEQQRKKSNPVNKRYMF